MFPRWGWDIELEEDVGIGAVFEEATVGDIAAGFGGDLSKSELAGLGYGVRPCGCLDVVKSSRGRIGRFAVERDDSPTLELVPGLVDELPVRLDDFAPYVRFFDKPCIC